MLFHVSAQRGLRVFRLCSSTVSRITCQHQTNKKSLLIRSNSKLIPREEPRAVRVLRVHSVLFCVLPLDLQRQAPWRRRWPRPDSQSLARLTCGQEIIHKRRNEHWYETLVVREQRRRQLTRPLSLFCTKNKPSPFLLDTASHPSASRAIGGVASPSPLNRYLRSGSGA